MCERCKDTLASLEHVMRNKYDCEAIALSTPVMRIDKPGDPDSTEHVWVFLPYVLPRYSDKLH